MDDGVSGNYHPVGPTATMDRPGPRGSAAQGKESRFITPDGIGGPLLVIVGKPFVTRKERLIQDGFGCRPYQSLDRDPPSPTFPAPWWR